ncbi:MAG: isochorismatase family protein, partial [Plesiomonas shigelloides]
THIVLGGLATDYCVKTTALQLQRSGHFTVLLNLAACRGIAPETTALACQEMAAAGVYLCDNQETLQHTLQQLTR